MQAAHEGINYVSIIHIYIHLRKALFLKCWYKNNIQCFCPIFCVKVCYTTKYGAELTVLSAIFDFLLIFMSTAIYHQSCAI